MHQASVLDGLSFDPFSFQQDGVASAEVNIGRCQVADGLVVTLVVVVIDEGIDLGLEIARQVVVLEQDAAAALDFCFWPNCEVTAVPKPVSCWGHTGRRADITKPTCLTQSRYCRFYYPAARHRCIAESRMALIPRQFDKKQA